jgi:hypothetical protein
MDINEYMAIERDTQKRFMESVLKDYFEIQTNVRWKKASEYAEFDMLLFKNSIPYVVVEIKMTLNPKTLSRAKDTIGRAYKLIHCRFGIITDNKDFYLIDYSKSSSTYTKMDFDSVVHCLIHPDDIVPSILENDNDEIEKVLSICFDETTIKHIRRDLNYDPNLGFYSFDNIDKEKNFFQMIVGLPKCSEMVFRYTSLETLFVMLNKGTYRMNGIVGMNDKSEIDYFDKKSNMKSSGLSIRELNKTYISSCSFLEDDLTMWRLYGDDAQGVCLVFEIVPVEKRHEDFFLAPVNYEEKGHVHKALEMLKKMATLKIRFVELDKWKHFFKPFEYAVEQEIRLMFFDNEKYNNGVINRDWVKTWSHSIVNPIVDFKLNAPSFPLQLRRVILGPKMLESNINKGQLEDLISTRGYNIQVDFSKIDNYR